MLLAYQICQIEQSKCLAQNSFFTSARYRLTFARPHLKLNLCRQPHFHSHFFSRLLLYSRSFKKKEKKEYILKLEKKRVFFVLILNICMPRRTLSKYFQAIKFVAVNGISAALLNLLSNHFIKKSLLIFFYPPFGILLCTRLSVCLNENAAAI